MKLEDIVHSINNLLIEKRKEKDLNIRGYFNILRRSYKPSTFTNALKSYEIKVYYVINKKESVVIINKIITSTVTSEVMENKTLKELDLIVFDELLLIISNNELFNKLIEGNYDNFK